MPELFVEAGLALATLLCGDVTPAPTDPSECVSVEASDSEALLMAWLNELIYRSEVSKRVYNELRVERLEACRLDAVIRGFEPALVRTAVKAATFHRLRVEREQQGYRACVVFDV